MMNVGKGNVPVPDSLRHPLNSLDLQNWFETAYILSVSGKATRLGVRGIGIIGFVLSMVNNGKEE